MLSDCVFMWYFPFKNILVCFLADCESFCQQDWCWMDCQLEKGYHQHADYPSWKWRCVLKERGKAHGGLGGTGGWEYGNEGDGGREEGGREG